MRVPSFLCSLRCTSAIRAGVVPAIVLGITAAAVAQVDSPPATQPSEPRLAAIQRTAYDGYEIGYPAPEVQAVPFSRAAAARARWQYRQAQTDLYRTVGTLYEDFENSPEYLRLRAEEAEAYDTYVQARQAVLARLQQDPGYRAQVELSADLREQIERVRPWRPAQRSMRLSAWAEMQMSPSEQLLSMARVRLGYNATASAMEAAALAADERVQSARTRLVDLGMQASVMRERFRRQVRRDQDFLAARQSVDSARIENITAATFHNGTVEARNIAVDYAYYGRHQDRYRYQGLGYFYPPYVYGYGYDYNYRYTAR